MQGTLRGGGSGQVSLSEVHVRATRVDQKPKPGIWVAEHPPAVSCDLPPLDGLGIGGVYELTHRRGRTDRLVQRDPRRVQVELDESPPAREHYTEAA